MRTEFAVLTGISDEAVGYDRFNPYFAFARSDLPSLATRLRADGYKTICLHPFDRTFYGRDQVMPKLGFDSFIGEEAFAGAVRSAGYITDREVARVTLELLREFGPKVFIFVITMENHGPWDGTPTAQASSDFAGDFPEIPDRIPLGKFISGIRNADAMLGSIADALAAMGGGLCAFYGDHLPSFPAAFPALGFSDTSSDYLIWRAGFGNQVSVRSDLPAHALSGAIMSAIYPTSIETNAKSELKQFGTPYR